jgi:transcriptional regulator with XRE-family HTH domain
MVHKDKSHGHTVPLPVRRAEGQLAEHIAHWRKLRGLTQAQLADRSGVARSTLQRIEAADMGVSVENLLRILRALGLLELIPRTLDPLASDVGRLRSEERLPLRVRPRQLTVDPRSKRDENG